MITHCVGNELKDEGIMACLLHPGWVQTEMGGPNALISTTQSVEGVFHFLLVY